MRHGYGQFCPVAKAAEIFCERWNALIFRELATGSTRFSEIQRGVPAMSPSMLSRRLKTLAREGVIEGDGAGGYQLSEAGREFAPLVHALGVWGRRWTRRQLESDEIDYRLLLWGMERTVRGDAFGPRRSVIELVFTDMPERLSRWWFLNGAARAELCLKDEGFEIDLYLVTTVADMIHVWRGDVPLARALAEDRLEAHGSRTMARRLGTWLNLSDLAAVESMRAGERLAQT